MTPIEGTFDPKFRGLKNAVAQNFADGLEIGASVAVVVDGKMVAELWGGHADQSRHRPWQRDTLTNVWSCTKGVVAAAVAMTVERGLLTYDQPIAKVWPEFAAAGKEEISLDLVMSHCAGLNGLNHVVDEEIVLDWAGFKSALAAMTPNWKPGTACAYHALTYGHLASEPLRRVTGQSIGQFIATQIAGPLGASFYVGLPEAEDHRVAEMIAGPKAYDWVQQVLQSKYPQACKSPQPNADAANQRRWRAAEIPGGNGHATALGLATIYGDLVGSSSKLLSKTTLAEASRVRFKGLDESFESETCWGAGFRVGDQGTYGARAALSSIGHGGWGGSLAFGDPESKLGFAYVTNHMLGFDDGIDPRRARLIEAVYDALSA